jgi:hypothetical protein
MVSPVLEQLAEERDRIVGALPRAALEQRLEPVLN